MEHPSREPKRHSVLRSKVTWQSILGYLPVYPWINCEVSKDTFSGQFSDYMEHSPKHARRLSHRYVSRFSFILPSSLIYVVKHTQQVHYSSCLQKVAISFGWGGVIWYLCDRENTRRIKPLTKDSNGTKWRQHLEIKALFGVPVFNVMTYDSMERP